MMTVALTGFTSTSLNTALGTPKNPVSVFQEPYRPKKGTEGTQERTIRPLYEALIKATYKLEALQDMPEAKSSMRVYLGVGFALSDAYCANFFAKTDEAYRRRQFGRTLTNDVGTIMTTVLGLAKAGEAAVTGLAATVGLADSTWRNYDDAFVVSPDLSNVQTLVFAAQDNFRARILQKDENLPRDYGTAQSTVRRYANLCSFLGMDNLLGESAAKQKNELNADTAIVTATTPAKTDKTAAAADTTSAPVVAAAPTAATPSTRPDIAILPLASNRPQ